jgi:hypothetical protein
MKLHVHRSVIIIALMITISGCNSHKRQELSERKKNLHAAINKLMIRLDEYHTTDLKTALLAAKYGVSEDAVEEYINIFELEQQVSRKPYESLLYVTNIAQIEYINGEIDSLPSAHDALISVSNKHGISPKKLAALLIEYYMWSSLEISVYKDHPIKRRMLLSP